MQRRRDDFLTFLRLTNVVVVQDKNLGDSLLTTPMIKCLKRLAPNAKLTVICKHESFPIFECVDGDITCVSSESSITSLIGVIARAEIVFLTRPSSRYAFLCDLVRVPFVSHRLSSKWIRPRWEVPHYNNLKRHVAEKNLDLLRRVGAVIEQSDKRLIFAGGHKSLPANNKFEALKGCIIIHPGTRWLFKTPQLHFWIAVIQRLKKAGYQCVLTGDAVGQEGQLLDAIASKTECASLAGQTSYCDLVGLLQTSLGYLGVDTFCSHLAAAIGVPGLVLFGPTLPELWGPWGAANRLIVIQDETKTCLGCGADGCGGSKKSECLDDLNASDIVMRLCSSLS